MESEREQEYETKFKLIETKDEDNNSEIFGVVSNTNQITLRIPETNGNVDFISAVTFWFRQGSMVACQLRSLNGWTSDLSHFTNNDQIHLVYCEDKTYEAKLGFKRAINGYRSKLQSWYIYDGHAFSEYRIVRVEDR